MSSESIIYNTFNFFARAWGYKNDKKEKYEKVITNEIDRINAIREKEGAQPANLSIWLRECKDEIEIPIEGKNSGDIPNWLNGTLIRNGPGLFSFGDSKFAHLFDGSALLHKFCIKSGKITYQRKFLKSETFKKNQIAQRIVVNEFGTEGVPDPCKTIFQKFSAIFETEEQSDNCVISVYPFKDELFTFTESCIIYRIDPKNLETMYPVNLTKYLNIVHHTSHPHVTEDGTVYNLGLSIGPTGPKYSIVQFPNTRRGNSTEDDVFKEAKVVAEVKTRWPLNPGYMHTFGITENYFVIVEQPLSVSVPELFKQKIYKTAGYKLLKWYEEQETIIYVISRLTGEVIQKYVAETLFYLHIINQYEDNDHVVIDICAYKDASMIDCMFIESIKNAHNSTKYATLFRGRPVRFILPLSPQNLTEYNLVTLANVNAKAFWKQNGDIYVIPELLCDSGCETPRINYPKYLGRKYKYFYGVSSDIDDTSYNGGVLLKVDTETKTTKTWTEQGISPNEPIFVPSPDQKCEDDGIILSSILWDDQPNKVALLILDAKSFTEINRTEFITPDSVTKCYHGWFNNDFE